MADSVAKLAVKMNFDATQMSGGLDAIQKKSQDVAKGIQSSFAAIPGGFAGLGALLTAGGIGEFFKSGLDQVVGLQRESAKLGVNLRDAAAVEQLAGDRGEAFSHALAHMEEAIGKARAGSDEFAKKLQAVGVSADQVAQGGAVDAYKQIADRIKGMDSAYDRAAAIQEIFGKGGKEVTDIILKGGDGFELAASKVDKFRLAMTQAEAEQVKQAKKAIGDIGLAFEGLKRQAAIAFAPQIKDAADYLQGKMQAIVNLMHGDFKPFGGVQTDLAFLEKVTRPNRGITDQIAQRQKEDAEKAAAKQTAALPHADDIDKLTQQYQKQYDTIIYGAKRAELEMLRQKMIQEEMDRIPGGRPGSDFRKNVATRNVDARLEELQNYAKLQDVIEQVNKLQFEGLNIYDAQNAKLEEFRLGLSGIKDIGAKAFQALQQEAQKLLPVLEQNKRWQLFAQTRTPLEGAQARFAELNQLFEKGAKDPALYARAVTQLSQDLIKQAGLSSSVQLPSIATAGSSAALQFQAQSQVAGTVGSIVDQLRAAIEALKQSQDRETKATEDLLQFFQAGVGVF